MLLLWPINDEMRKAQALSPQEVREVVEERRRSVSPIDRLRNLTNKKEQVEDKPEEKPEVIDQTDEASDNPAAQPEAVQEQEHHTEQGAE